MHCFFNLSSVCLSALLLPAHLCLPIHWSICSIVHPAACIFMSGCIIIIKNAYMKNYIRKMILQVKYIFIFFTYTLIIILIYIYIFNCITCIYKTLVIIWFSSHSICFGTTLAIELLSVTNHLLNTFTYTITCILRNYTDLFILNGMVMCRMLATNKSYS